MWLAFASTSTFPCVRSGPVSKSKELVALVGRRAYVAKQLGKLSRLEAVMETNVKTEHLHDDEVVEMPSVYLDSTGHHLNGADAYLEMYQRSVDDPETFWGEMSSDFEWKGESSGKPVFEGNFDIRNGGVFARWFDGRLTNICYNALDRMIERGMAEKVAIYYEGNDLEDDHRSVTYAELHETVCRIANVLVTNGVKKGDIVCVCMPMIVELPATMLACARIGAIHSVVFGGFSSQALAGRILDSKSTVIVSCDGVMRGSKMIRLKSIADEAIVICAEQGHVVKRQLSFSRLGREICDVTFVEGRDAWMRDEMDQVGKECPVEWVPAEHPLFVLYTSGSTGKPKGIVHSTGGYMVYAATTFKHSFNYQMGDVFFCTADCGWITGHSYVTYGPLLNGASQVVFEGVPNFPDAGRLWAIVDKYEVAQIYTAPTAIRALKQMGDEFVLKHSRKSLKVLGTVGEPINPEAWQWYYEVVGGSRCPIADTWWQTETGGHVLTTLPVRGMKMKPGSAGFPFFGCVPAILNEAGEEMDGPCEGYLVMKSPWPGMLRTIYGDHSRMESVYFERFKGYYLTGDACRRDKDGYIWVTGRVDDVLNVSGHRIGTAEVESALVLDPAVAEAAVVGYPHDIKGEGIYAFVTLMRGQEPSDALKKQLVARVRHEIGPIASPDIIHWAPSLPKTRSGKIMRRILRKLARFGPKVDREEFGDISTLADPGAIETLIAEYGK